MLPYILNFIENKKLWLTSILGLDGDAAAADDDEELFCGMVDRRKAFSLISSLDHCQISSPLRISNMLWAGFKPVQNLNSGLVERSCAVVITTTPLVLH